MKKWMAVVLVISIGCFGGFDQNPPKDQYAVEVGPGPHAPMLAIEVGPAPHSPSRTTI